RQRTDARPDDRVRPDPRLLQRLRHPDVRDALHPPATQHENRSWLLAIHRLELARVSLSLTFALRVLRHDSPCGRPASMILAAELPCSRNARSGTPIGLRHGTPSFRVEPKGGA